MEVTLNPAAAAASSDQMDSVARPPEDGAEGDGEFELLLAMALQAAPLVAAPSTATGSQLADAGLAAPALPATPADGGSALESTIATLATTTASEEAPAGQTDITALLDAAPGAEVLPPIAARLGRELKGAPNAHQIAASSGDALRGVDLRATSATSESAAQDRANGSSFLSAGGEGNDTRERGASDLAMAAGRDHQIAQPASTDGGADRVDGFAALAPAAPEVRGASAVRASSTHAGGPSLVPQLLDGLHVAVGRQGSAVRLQLQPEGLGSVDLHVASGESGLAIHIAVEDPATRDMIQAAVGQLTQSLEGRGLAVAHLLVDLATSQDGQGGAASQPFEQPAAAGPLRPTDPPLAPENDVADTEGSAAAYRIDYRV